MHNVKPYPSFTFPCFTHFQEIFSRRAEPFQCHHFRFYLVFLAIGQLLNFVSNLFIIHLSARIVFNRSILPYSCFTIVIFLANISKFSLHSKPGQVERFFSERAFSISEVSRANRVNGNNSETLLKVDITYKVSQLVAGQFSNFKGNTVTNNDPMNGRIISSAIHTIVRDQSNIIVSEFDRSIRELSYIQKQWLILSCPQATFPFTLRIFFLAIGIRLIITFKRGVSEKYFNKVKQKQVPQNNKSSLKN